MINKSNTLILILSVGKANTNAPPLFICDLTTKSLKAPLLITKVETCKDHEYAGAR